MISLTIDGKERVCLAQISNSLLKKYSYNEIHNRRVALGINCIQCTPMQLEIFRRAGAMPASSRRCGMITKKEAERLVKSFLDENKPPSLPESFSFSVEHKCEYGCKGTFYPSRYNSSRAKCIRCSYCNVFFSPNKFIFHSHETSSAKYAHAGNLNFNSWRKHIFLINETNDEQLNSAWEDVKSIFNSGKRKRGGQVSDTESDLEYSFTESKEEVVQQQEKQNSQIYTEPNLQFNLMNILNPIYSSNLLPELLQLNRTFLLQNQLNTQEIFRNYFMSKQIEANENKHEKEKSAFEKPKKFFSIAQHLE